jgi:hypothetical protein
LHNTLVLSDPIGTAFALLSMQGSGGAVGWIKWCVDIGSLNVDGAMTGKQTTYENKIIL